MTTWRCELDPFCRRVLAHRLPPALLFDDVRDMSRSDTPPVDVLVGGFPCQDLSIAGRRAGLQAERSGLFFQFVRLIRVLKPSWWVLENVPGFLTATDGLDFAVALRELDACGYVGAWRVLDSQYFGLAQRRARVFLVGSLRAGGAESVLFESASGEGDSTAGDETRPHLAATLRGRAHGAGVHAPGRGGEDDVNLTVVGGGSWPTLSDELTPPVTGRRADQTSVCGVHANQRGELRTSGLAGSLNGSRSGKQFEGVFATLNSGGNQGGFRTEPGEHLVVAGERARALVGSMFKRHDDDTDTLIAYTLNASHGTHLGQGHNTTYPQTPNGVRRLTPLECERLQGFPDGWTCLCGEGHRGSSFCRCTDGPRYKALGNAVSVPVAEWIGRRIACADPDGPGGA